MFQIEEELKKLPKQPGVYIMHDAEDTILYVGKAINLHSRVLTSGPISEEDHRSIRW